MSPPQICKDSHIVERQTRTNSPYLAPDSSPSCSWRWHLSAMEAQAFSQPARGQTDRPWCAHSEGQRETQSKHPVRQKGTDRVSQGQRRRPRARSGRQKPLQFLQATEGGGVESTVKARWGGKGRALGLLRGHRGKLRGAWRRSQDGEAHRREVKAVAMSLVKKSPQQC